LLITIIPRLLRSVKDIAEPVQTGYLKKRSMGVMKRWNKLYFEAGDNTLTCYKVRVCQ
jgi:hypothetical protein